MASATMKSRMPCPSTSRPAATCYCRPCSSKPASLNRKQILNPMKVLIARLNHETNTFSPVPTPLSAFGDRGPDYGPDAYRANKGAVTAMGAFIDLAESWGAEIVTPLSATAYPSGPVDAEAYESMCSRIVDAARDCDALMLDLHGAMVVQSTDDGEGDLLERLRLAYPGVPIAVSLDLHGNVTSKMMANADIITGFKTY